MNESLEDRLRRAPLLSPSAALDQKVGQLFVHKQPKRRHASYWMAVGMAATVLLCLAGSWHLRQGQTAPTLQIRHQLVYQDLTGSSQTNRFYVQPQFPRSEAVPPYTIRGNVL